MSVVQLKKSPFINIKYVKKKLLYLNALSLPAQHLALDVI